MRGAEENRTDFPVGPRFHLVGGTSRSGLEKLRLDQYGSGVGSAENGIYSPW